MSSSKELKNQTEKPSLITKKIDLSSSITNDKETFKITKFQKIFLPQSKTNWPSSLKTNKYFIKRTEKPSSSRLLETNPGCDTLCATPAIKTETTSADPLILHLMTTPNPEREVSILNKIEKVLPNKVLTPKEKTQSLPFKEQTFSTTLFTGNDILSSPESDRSLPIKEPFSNISKIEESISMNPSVTNQDSTSHPVNHSENIVTVTIGTGSVLPDCDIICATPAVEIERKLTDFPSIQSSFETSIIMQNILVNDSSSKETKTNKKMTTSKKEQIDLKTFNAIVPSRKPETNLTDLNQVNMTSFISNNFIKKDNSMSSTVANEVQLIRTTISQKDSLEINVTRTNFFNINDNLRIKKKPKQKSSPGTKRVTTGKERDYIFEAVSPLETKLLKQNSHSWFVNTTDRSVNLTTFKISPEISISKKENTSLQRDLNLATKDVLHKQKIMNQSKDVTVEEPEMDHSGLYEISQIPEEKILNTSIIFEKAMYESDFMNQNNTDILDSPFKAQQKDVINLTQLEDFIISNNTQTPKLKEYQITTGWLKDRTFKETFEASNLLTKLAEVSSKKEEMTASPNQSIFLTAYIKKTLSHIKSDITTLDHKPTDISNLISTKQTVTSFKDDIISSNIEDIDEKKNEHFKHITSKSFKTIEKNISEIKKPKENSENGQLKAKEIINFMEESNTKSPANHSKSTDLKSKTFNFFQPSKSSKIPAGLEMRNNSAKSKLNDFKKSLKKFTKKQDLTQDISEIYRGSTDTTTPQLYFKDELLTMTTPDYNQTFTTLFEKEIFTQGLLTHKPLQLTRHKTMNIFQEKNNSQQVTQPKITKSDNDQIKHKPVTKGKTVMVYEKGITVKEIIPSYKMTPEISHGESTNRISTTLIKPKLDTTQPIISIKSKLLIDSTKKILLDDTLMTKPNRIQINTKAFTTNDIMKEKDKTTNNIGSIVQTEKVTSDVILLDGALSKIKTDKMITSDLSKEEKYWTKVSSPDLLASERTQKNMSNDFIASIQTSEFTPIKNLTRSLPMDRDVTIDVTDAYTKNLTIGSHSTTMFPRDKISDIISYDRTPSLYDKIIPIPKSNLSELIKKTPNNEQLNTRYFTSAPINHTIQKPGTFIPVNVTKSELIYNKSIPTSEIMYGFKTVAEPSDHKKYKVAHSEDIPMTHLTKKTSLMTGLPRDLMNTKSLSSQVLGSSLISKEIGVTEKMLTFYNRTSKAASINETIEDPNNTKRIRSKMPKSKEIKPSIKSVQKMSNLKISTKSINFLSSKSLKLNKIKIETGLHESRRKSKTIDFLDLLFTKQAAKDPITESMFSIGHQKIMSLPPNKTQDIISTSETAMASKSISLYESIIPRETFSLHIMKDTTSISKSFFFPKLKTPPQYKAAISNMMTTQRTPTFSYKFTDKTKSEIIPTIRTHLKLVSSKQDMNTILSSNKTTPMKIKDYFIKSEDEKFSMLPGKTTMGSTQTKMISMSIYQPTQNLPESLSNNKTIGITSFQLPTLQDKLSTAIIPYSKMLSNIPKTKSPSVIPLMKKVTKETLANNRNIDISTKVMSTGLLKSNEIDKPYRFTKIIPKTGITSKSKSSISLTEGETVRKTSSTSKKIKMKESTFNQSKSSSEFLSLTPIKIMTQYTTSIPLVVIDDGNVPTENPILKSIYTKTLPNIEYKSSLISTSKMMETAKPKFYEILTKMKSSRSNTETTDEDKSLTKTLNTIDTTDSKVSNSKSIIRILPTNTAQTFSGIENTTFKSKPEIFERQTLQTTNVQTVKTNMTNVSRVDSVSEINPKSIPITDFIRNNKSLNITTDQIIALNIITKEKASKSSILNPISLSKSFTSIKIPFFKTSKKIPKFDNQIQTSSQASIKTFQSDSRNAVTDLSLKSHSIESTSISPNYSYPFTFDLDIPLVSEQIPSSTSIMPDLKTIPKKIQKLQTIYPDDVNEKVKTTINTDLNNISFHRPILSTHKDYQIKSTTNKQSKSSISESIINESKMSQGEMFSKSPISSLIPFISKSMDHSVSNEISSIEKQSTKMVYFSESKFINKSLNSLKDAKYVTSSPTEITMKTNKMPSYPITSTNFPVNISKKIYTMPIEIILDSSKKKTLQKTSTLSYSKTVLANKSESIRIKPTEDSRVTSIKRLTPVTIRTTNLSTLPNESTISQSETTYSTRRPISSTSTKQFPSTFIRRTSPQIVTSQGGKTVKTLFPVAGVELIGDDVMTPAVHLPSRVAFGTFYYENVYVTTNGYITFGKRQNFPSPQRFPDPPKVAMIAPFWSDLVVERPGRVTYKFYEEGQTTFHKAIQLIESYKNKKIKFDNWILVVTWENVQPSNRMRNLTEVATFQMALVPTHDEKKTFCIFTYLPGMQSWMKAVDHAEVSIGISDGRKFYKQNSHSFSLSALELHDIVGNTGKTGIWVESMKNQLDYRKKQCIKYAMNYVNWTQVIPHTCPCTQKQATADFRFKRVIKNKDFTTFESVFEQNGLKEQCVYIPGPYGGGTLTTGQPYGGAISIPNTSTTDEYMRKLCCLKKPSYCKQFYHHRPSSGCKNYHPPRLGWSWGDPHFHTMDGKDYTFNGWGEYEMVYMKDETFRMQIRIEDAISNGFAMKSSESIIVEVTISDNRDDINILINRTEKYRMSSFAESLQKPNVIIKKSNDSLLITFKNGVAVKVSQGFEILMGRVNFPSAISGETYGLLGYGNYIVDDDFIGRNGKKWNINSTDRSIFEFGETWRVKEKESLFTYTDKRTFQFYHNTSFVPTFFDEVDLKYLFSGNTSLLESAVKECLNYSFQEACLQDSARTGNIQAAVLGAEMHKETLNMQKYLDHSIPKLKQMPRFLSAQLYQNLTFKLQVENDSDDIPVLFYVKTTCKNYSFDKKEGIFHWTPLTSDPCRLQFHAIRSTIKDVISQEYWPSVHFCDCENGGQCNFNQEPSVEQKENQDRFYKLACICPKNFGGDRCEVTPCNLSHCHEKVRCKEKSGVPVCGNCPTSMLGTGKVCFGFCYITPCKNGGTCNQLANGTYYCSCPQGYGGYLCEGDHSDIKIKETALGMGIGLSLAILLLFSLCLLVCCVRRRRQQHQEYSSGLPEESIASWIPQHQFFNEDYEPQYFRTLKQTLSSDPWETIRTTSSDGPAFLSRGIPAFFSSSIRGLNGAKLSEWSPGALQVNLREDDLAV